MHEQCNMKNTMEHVMSTMLKASNMAYGWHQIINNTAHCYDTPYNIELIVEQLSKHNMLLRDQIETENDVFAKQNNLIRDESRCA